MTTELPKTYEPAAAQTRWVEHWLNQGLLQRRTHSGQGVSTRS
jgi:hypothetical protein